MNIESDKINVLMVYPEFLDTSFWSFRKAVEILGLGATMPPIGLATLAAMLPKPFHVMPIVDMNIEKLTNAHLEEADIVMISAMIVQKGSLRNVIAMAKRLGKTVVVGGPYATSYPEDVVEMGADHLVLNEAETTLAPFIEDYLSGHAMKIYDEVSVRPRIETELTKEGKPVITGTPVPIWNLLKLRRYSSLAIQYSRGCPFNCDFCDITNLFGHISRTKSPEQVIAELQAIFDTGWRGSIFFVDDNFIGNQNEVRELLPMLIKWQHAHRYPFTFFTEASMNLANPNLRDVRELMIDAGFDEVFVGIESIDPEVIRAMNKRQNGSDPARRVKELQKAGFQITAGLIVGNDDDKPNVFRNLFAFIQESGIVMAMPGLLTALRGTNLYKYLFKEGRLREESTGNNTHQFKLNFRPIMDESLLVDGYIDLLQKLFSSKNYYARCRTLRARRGHHRKVSRLNRNGILATARIFHHNLIKRPDIEFVKFIFGTLLTHPSDLPEAITQAVKLAHFDSVTREAIKAHRYPE